MTAADRWCAVALFVLGLGLFLAGRAPAYVTWPLYAAGLVLAAVATWHNVHEWRNR